MAVAADFEIRLLRPGDAAPVAELLAAALALYDGMGCQEFHRCRTYTRSTSPVLRSVMATGTPYLVRLHLRPGEYAAIKDEALPRSLLEIAPPPWGRYGGGPPGWLAGL